MDEIRLGMIGCGQISARFFNQARQLPGVRFVATCAAHEASARAKAEENHCEHWYTDHRQLLDDASVDAVVITTPHQLHAPMAIDALRAGKHTLVEKPLTTRLEHLRILAAELRSSRVTFMALPFVHTPAFLTALRYVREEYIGKITGIEADLSIPGPPRSNWYYSREAEGGAMLDTMVYPLARTAALMGPAKRIAAFTNQLIPHRLCDDGGQVESQVDDNVTILLEYATGQQAVVRSYWAQSFRQNGTVLHGRHGTIFLDRWGYPLIVKSDLTPVPDAKPIEFLGLEHCYAPAIPAMRVEDDIVGHFVHCIRTGERPHCDSTIGIHIAEQQMLAYQASVTNRIMLLESTFDLWWERPAGIMDLGQGYL
ncbi:MAG TPA: Gfo/Idh/MocA family oxidoreductase [Chloroflexota bacterium]|nr:Gfo/Idh/MocA family oxidoreductase [Chloroflexota bacterium]